METVKLKFNEVLKLETELNGVIDYNNGTVLVKGLLDERLSIRTKYWLSKLAKSLVTTKEEVEKLRRESVEKFGEPTDGGFSISHFIDNEKGEKIKNPNLEKYLTEYNELLNDEKEFNYTPLSLSDFDGLKTEANCEILFKLIKETNEANV